MFDDCSHRVELIIGIVSFFIAFCTSTYFIHWISVSVVAITCLIIDFTFFQEGSFIYDPDYNHWQDLNQINEMKEFQIKTE